MTTHPTPNFEELLRTAVTVPGTIAAAYTAFHHYSMGNMLLASAQLAGRGIPLGPIATYPGWKALGRHVKAGEKALMLCMPVTVKRDAADGSTDDPGVFTRFVYRNNWFVLAQTDGADLPPVELPTWSTDRALSTLDVTRIEFSCPDGNTLGYAKDRTIAINPVNTRPFGTLFHELAHVLLGHTAEAQTLADDERTPRSLRECEAEAVALLCCESLGLPGGDESRGYIQHWYGSGQPIPEKSAQKILKAADQILKAGRESKEAS